jgi:hypothetical protein
VMIASELAWCLSMLRGSVTWVIDLIEAWSAVTTPYPQTFLFLPYETIG